MHWSYYIYRFASLLLQCLASIIIHYRKWQGKEHPTRYIEKFGKATQTRPKGTLIWLHAVGLGEVLTIPIIIAALQKQQPNLQFLITSTSLSSAIAIAKNMPVNSIHQFLPLDYPLARKRFLNHWQPNLAVWVEQDLWPGFIVACRNRNIPLALINVRLLQQSKQKKQYFASLFQYCYRQFHLIAAKDSESQTNLQQLSGRTDIQLLPSLKRAIAKLPVDNNKYQQWQQLLSNRSFWLAASLHLDELSTVLQAHKLVLQSQPKQRLIIVPRYPIQAAAFADQCQQQQLKTLTISNGKIPMNSSQIDVLLIASFGEMGLWYQLANVALIGGSLCNVGGHNPFEAIAMHCAVLVGPQTHNFANDYQELLQCDAASLITDSQSLAIAVCNLKLQQQLQKNGSDYLKTQQQSSAYTAEHANHCIVSTSSQPHRAVVSQQNVAAVWDSAMSINCPCVATHCISRRIAFCPTSH